MSDCDKANMGINFNIEHLKSVNGYLSLPHHAQQVLLLVVVKFQFALVGMMQGFADAAGEMDGGSP
jgi:hypothetical protein